MTMTNEERARDYAYARQKNLHLSQRDTNLIQLAYLHGLEDNRQDKQLTEAKAIIKIMKHLLFDVWGYIAIPLEKRVNDFLRSQA